MIGPVFAVVVEASVVAGAFTHRYISLAHKLTPSISVQSTVQLAAYFVRDSPLPRKRQIGDDYGVECERFKNLFSHQYYFHEEI